MKNSLCVAMLAFALAACRETPDETAADVADARREGAENVQEADRAAREARPGDRADAEFELAQARAKAALEVEQERCDGLPADLRPSCKDNAKAVHDRAIAEARRLHALSQRPATGDRAD